MKPQRTLFSDNIQDQFEKFHSANPHIYATLVRLARKAQQAGMKTYGVASLFEQVRWHYNVEVKNPVSEFKLSNNFRSRYARLIMAQEKDLTGFFTLRALRAD